MPAKEFYQKMRDGGVAKTTAVNREDFLKAFAAELDAGRDVLYLGFSSGLSGTCEFAHSAAEELNKTHPDRRVTVVDTLSASLGYGLIVYLTVKKKREGADLEEAARYASELRPHLCHWFTVDDLVYLKRGGRISPTVALVGTILGIKPVLHMDDEGHLINMFKVRGRKAALKAVAQKYSELVMDRDAPIFISHGDCLKDAETVAELIRTATGAQVELISDVGPVIGAHSGPGTIALFFVGTHR